MLFKRKYLAVLVAAAMVSACGGGSGDDSTTAGNAPVTNPGTGSTTPPPTTGTTTPPADTGTTPPADGGTTTPTTPPATGGQTVVDQKMTGHLQIVANQVVYLRTARDIYNANTIEQLESQVGMYDVAAGSTGSQAETDATVKPSATAPAAPIASFGFRVDKYVQQESADQVVANQTVVGRVAFSFVENANSAGIGNGEVAESMSFVIDRVEIATDATGMVSAVRVLDGAQMVVTGRNATGTQVTETIPVGSTAVRLLPVSEVLDNGGDTSSTVLLVDLESAFAQAGTRLAALQDLRGHFAMKMTMSNAAVVRPASGSLQERQLTGDEITVGTQPAVSGAGVSGSVWVRMLPPA